MKMRVGMRAKMRRIWRGTRRRACVPRGSCRTARFLGPGHRTVLNRIHSYVSSRALFGALCVNRWNGRNQRVADAASARHIWGEAWSLLLKDVTFYLFTYATNRPLIFHFGIPNASCGISTGTLFNWRSAPTLDLLYPLPSTSIIPVTALEQRCISSHNMA